LGFLASWRETTCGEVRELERCGLAGTAPRERALCGMRITLLASLILLGCAHTTECKSRINDCLRACPPHEEPALQQGDPRLNESARRPQTTCEARCESTCQAEASPRPVDPASGPFAAPGS
jgi:hypothetical protein